MKTSFTVKLWLGLALLLAMASRADAAQPFEDQAFQAASESGQTVLVDVFATWCTTCAKQKPILRQIEARHPELRIFEIDFDGDKALLQRFQVQYQSTLILFKGGKELQRSTGETDPDRLEAFVSQGN